MTELDFDAYQAGWVAALDAVLQLLRDVERGVRRPEEVLEAIELSRLRALRAGQPTEDPRAWRPWKEREPEEAL